jgi:putative nucleotidyltransferase with HDIG domain
MEIGLRILEEDLPTFSEIAMQALELIKDPQTTTQKIEAVIRQDSGLTARLLHIANSPFYVRRMESKSIADAARRLGLRQLGNIIIAAASGELFDSSDHLAQHMWLHAQHAAFLTQTIAEMLRLPSAEEAYVAGLLHDIGCIVIYRQFPEEYKALWDRAKDRMEPFLEFEAQQFTYFSHMSVGGLLIRKWRLPEAIAESARFHHQVCTGPVDCLEHSKLVCSVGLADQLVEWVSNESNAPVETLLELHCAQELGITAAQLHKLADQIRERLSEAA